MQSRQICLVSSGRYGRAIGRLVLSFVTARLGEFRSVVRSHPPLLPHTSPSLLHAHPPAPLPPHLPRSRAHLLARPLPHNLSNNRLPPRLRARPHVPHSHHPRDEAAPALAARRHHRLRDRIRRLGRCHLPFHRGRYCSN